MTVGLPGIPADRRLPEAAGLLGEARTRALEKFLRRRGWTLVESRPVQALYTPGRSFLVRSRAWALNRQGDPRLVSLTCEARNQASAPPAPPPELEERYGIPEPVERIDPYLVWSFPYDPSLPDLPNALQTAELRDVFARYGPRPIGIGVKPLRYRPRRRAVFSYKVRLNSAGPWEEWFGKVLRTTTAERVARLQPAPRRWFGLGARHAPRVGLAAGPAEGGLVLFRSLEGRSLRDLLTEGGSLPRPERIAALVDEIPHAIGEIENGPGTGERDPTAGVRRAGELVSRLTPEARQGVERIIAAVEDGVGSNQRPLRLVHGDLYEAQVLVGDGFSLGLIDLDDVGLGDPLVDAANFSTHLLALALSVPRAAPRLLAYRELVRRAFLERLGASDGELAWREAASMLLLAAGPFRVLQPTWPSGVIQRVDLALRLLDGPAGGVYGTHSSAERVPLAVG